MVSQSQNTHLTREEIIKSGSVYTGKELVELVYSHISSFINDKTVFGDFGSGYGSFIEKFKDYGKSCFGTEFDKKSFELLCLEYPNIKFYHENSLLNISREKYGLTSDDELIAIGNPPYNDVTSIFKKGEKGELICDEDVSSRDFGISFLKTYNKLKAKYICVLHPLGYLIKKQNFNSLGAFNYNYKLLKATIFSSKEFESIKKTNSDFPVICALYERTNAGMDYSYIQNFSFGIFKSDKTFKLKDILTIDGIVEKYPKKDRKDGLQFYTLRDMNALLRNAGFVENRPTNGLEVTDSNLYQYAWLFFLKMNFNPQVNRFIYGNLSPLYTTKIDSASFKNEVVSYAYNNSELIRKYYTEDKIKALYGPITDQYNALFDELENLNNLFK